MLEGLLNIFVVVGFLLWDYLELRLGKSQPLSRKSMARGFIPGMQSAFRLSLFGAAVTATMGILEWHKPSEPPFFGKGAWIVRTVYELFGPRGMAVVFGGVTVAFLLAALTARQKAARDE